MVAYIDEHRGQFGVQPICQVLKEHGVAIAPSTYYAAKDRPPSARARQDVALLAEITRVYKENGEVYVARKVCCSSTESTSRRRGARWSG